MTTPLSPAALKVLDAFLNAYVATPDSSNAFAADRSGIAAALIAAADQVVPEEPPLTQRQNNNVVCVKRYQQRHEIRCKLLALATELRQEGQP